MATFALQIVPASLDANPTSAQLHSASNLLLSYISDIEGRVKVEIFDKPTLVDTGAAFETMSCPVCHTLLERFRDDDHGEWWYEMETRVSESPSPMTEMFEMPCCQQEVRADQLQFGKDALFVRWMLRANGYELYSERGELDNEQLLAIEAVLGCKVQQLICVNG